VNPLAKGFSINKYNGYGKWVVRIAFKAIQGLWAKRGM